MGRIRDRNRMAAVLANQPRRCWVCGKLLGDMGAPKVSDRCEKHPYGGEPFDEGLDARDLVKERFGDPASEAHAVSREKAARFGAPEGAEPTRCRRCGLPVTRTEDDRWAHIGPTSCTRVVLDEGRSA